MLKLRTGLALGALGLSLGTLANCTVTNLEHCALNQGGCGDGLACSMCAIDNNGCVPLGALIEEACVFAGSGLSTSMSGQTTDSDPTITPTDTTDTFAETIDPTKTSLNTTEGTASLGDTTDQSTITTDGNFCVGDIVGNPACGGETPYCVDGSCVGCDDLGTLGCSEVEPAKPTCAAHLGLCVECQEHSDCMTAERPACNEPTAICVPCDSHEECPMTACNLETGQCFPMDQVLYVENTTDPPVSCSDDKPGWGSSKSQPLCTLQNALQRLTQGKEWTIKIKSGGKAQNKLSVVPKGNYTVAIVHHGNTVPSLVIPFADPALTVNAGNTVFMSQIGIFNWMPMSDPLVLCEGEDTGARLWLEQQRLFGGNTAIRATNCHVHVRRSTITGNANGGIEISGSNADLAKLWVENSHLNDNGSKFGAIRAGDKASVDILYSTIALNNSPVAPIECVDNWAATMNVRNSALVNPGPLFGGGCGTVQPVDSFLLPNSGGMGTLMEVFSGFSDGVYQANDGGSLKDVAVWRTGDPAVDYDGSKRPTDDGATDYAGADHPSF